MCVAVCLGADVQPVSTQGPERLMEEEEGGEEEEEEEDFEPFLKSWECCQPEKICRS